MSAPPRALSNPPFLAPARGLGSRDYSCILPGFPVDCHLWRIRRNIPCGLSSAVRQAINSRVSDPAIILASLAGHDTAREPAAVRRQIGYHAGSDLGFYARLTGRQNLLFFGRLNHLSDEFAASRIESLSERFGLRGALDRQARALSSGTIQRLSLLRALLHQPKVLLLDEPTRSLDAIAAADFRHFLKTEVLARKDSSLLFASHTMQEIELLADRVAILNEGKLLAFDTPTALRARTLSSSLEEAFARLTGRHLYSPGERTPE